MPFFMVKFLRSESKSQSSYTKIMDIERDQQLLHLSSLQNKSKKGENKSVFNSAVEWLLMQWMSKMFNNFHFYVLIFFFHVN